MEVRTADDTKLRDMVAVGARLATKNVEQKHGSEGPNDVIDREEELGGRTTTTTGTKQKGDQ